jgi:hypothetical protein
MSEHHDLSRRPSFSKEHLGPYMVAPRSLTQNSDRGPALPPFARNDSSQAIHRSLVVARGFALHESLEQIKHMFLSALQLAQNLPHFQSRFAHRAAMLSAVFSPDNAHSGLIPTYACFV